MNKLGQLSVGIGILFAFVFFIIGMMTINFIKDEVTNSRVSTALDCSNSDISDGNKLTCLLVDWVVPYFIILVLSATGGYLISRAI